MAWYSIAVLVNGKWEVAKEGNWRKSLADGFFSQFATTYKTRMFRGKMLGKLVRSNEDAKK